MGMTYTIDNELLESASNMILEALSEISKDPINNRTTANQNYGNMVRDLSKSLKTLFLMDNNLLKSKGELLLKFFGF